MPRVLCGFEVWERLCFGTANSRLQAVQEEGPSGSDTCQLKVAWVSRPFGGSEPGLPELEVERLGRVRLLCASRGCTPGKVGERWPLWA
jgi:hypothetical protein